MKKPSALIEKLQRIAEQRASIDRYLIEFTSQNLFQVLIDIHNFIEVEGVNIGLLQRAEKSKSK